jgi:homoserine kinase
MSAVITIRMVPPRIGSSAAAALANVKAATMAAKADLILMRLSKSRCNYL